MPTRTRVKRATTARHAGGRDRCSGCHHEKRSQLDADLVAGISQRELAARYELSRSAIQRHRAHVSTSLARIDARGLTIGGSTATTDDVVAQARHLYQACRDAFDNAIEGGNLLNLALSAREARAGLELLGKFLERLESRRVMAIIDIQRSTQWARIRSVVMDVLKDHPELRVELTARLKALDAQAPAGNGHVDS